MSCSPTTYYAVAISRGLCRVCEQRDILAYQAPGRSGRRTRGSKQVRDTWMRRMGIVQNGAPQTLPWGTPINSMLRWRQSNPILQYCDMVIVEPINDARSGAPRHLPQYCNIAILQYLLAA